MCPDDNIAASVRKALNGLLLFGGGGKPREHANIHRESAHTLSKRVVVLLCENGRRHENGNLAAVLHRLERSTECDLGLSVPDITADQTVHNLRRLHVLLHIRNRRKLIVCLLIREHFLKLALPRRIRSEHMPLLRLALRIKLDKILGDLIDRLLDFFARVVPFLRAEAGEFRRGFVTARILLQDTQVRRKDVEQVAASVLDLDVILRDMVYFNLLDAAVDADAVILMDDIVAHLQILQRANLLAALKAVMMLLFLSLLAENIGLGDDHEADCGIFKAMSRMSVAGLDLSGRRHTLRVLRVESKRVRVREILRKASCACARRRENQDTLALLPGLLKIRCESVKTIIVRRGLAGMDVNLVPREERISLRKAADCRAAVF